MLRTGRGDEDPPRRLDADGEVAGIVPVEAIRAEDAEHSLVRSFVEVNRWQLDPLAATRLPLRRHVAPSSAAGHAGRQ